MGSRGTSTTNSSNVIQFRPRKENKDENISNSISKGNGWDYPGNKEAIDKLEKYINTVDNQNKASVAYKSINDLDKSISALMNEPDNGDKTVLMAQRRRVRLLKKKLLAKGEKLL